MAELAAEGVALLPPPLGPGGRGALQAVPHVQEAGEVGHDIKISINNIFIQKIITETLSYRVSHITGPTLFLLFSRVLEHIQRNFS